MGSQASLVRRLVITRAGQGKPYPRRAAGLGVGVIGREAPPRCQDERELLIGLLGGRRIPHRPEVRGLLPLPQLAMDILRSRMIGGRAGPLDAIAFQTLI